MRRFRRYLWFSVPLAFTMLAFGRPEGAGAQRVSINDGDGPLERCDQLDISFDNDDVVRAEETARIPATGRLDVHLSHHGGIGLSEAPGREHQITLCKAFPGGGKVNAESIRLGVDGSRVTVNGRQGERWVGYVIVRSPRGSHVSLRTTNGPLRADRFEGTLQAQTLNGPLALNEPRGTVTARAKNGPVKLSGQSGTVAVETQNGPIAIRLTGSRWTGGTLDAKAHNGPLSVTLPAKYGSGIEIASSGHAPWSCRGYEGCGAQHSMRGPRQLRLGEGAVQVRLSTVNGPISVRGGSGS